MGDSPSVSVLSPHFSPFRAKLSRVVTSSGCAHLLDLSEPQKKRRSCGALSLLLLCTVVVVYVAVVGKPGKPGKPGKSGTSGKSSRNFRGPVPLCTAGTANESRWVSSVSSLKIPYNIFVTDRAFEGATKEVWDNNVATFPDFFKLANFTFFDDATMSCLAKRIGRELSDARVADGAYEAFLSLRPPAFRADLWRYMVLWSSGGVYVDAKMMLRMDPRDWIDFERDSLVLVKDENYAYFNAIMASQRRSFALAKTLQLVVSNVLAQEYPRSDLNITGPEALGEAMGLSTVDCDGAHCDWICPVNLSTAIRNRETPRIQAYNNGSFVIVSCTERVIAQVNVDVRAHDKSDKKGYEELFDAHEVYCDEAGPPCPDACPDP